jgi:predicted amidohydrolase
MKLASAQINCTVGEIRNNLEEHYRMINSAIQNDVQLIIFPELSITGYCRAEGQALAFTERDKKLNTLQELSTKGNIILIVGAPIKIKDKLYIGTFIINPNQSIQIYTKQYLHGEEQLFYTSSFNHNPILFIENERIALAICADINNQNHPLQAEKNKCSIYLPSIFYSEKGLDKGYKQLSEYAKKHSLHILMSNYSGQLWGMKSGGGSAFWNSNGKLIKRLNSTETGLLIVEIENSKLKKNLTHSKTIK